MDRYKGTGSFRHWKAKSDQTAAYNVSSTHKPAKRGEVLIVFLVLVYALSISVYKGGVCGVYTKLGAKGGRTSERFSDNAVPCRLETDRKGSVWKYMETCVCGLHDDNNGVGGKG